MRARLNGQLLDDPSGATLSVTDHGFTVGDGVFESIKTLRGVPFALSRHVTRLGRSATGLGLEAPDEADVRRGVAAVLDGTADPLGRLRITYTGGPAPMGSGRGDGPATLVVAYSAIDPFPATTAVSTVPRAPQRAQCDRRPQDHVVRRERDRPRARERARGHRGDLRQHARRPLRGHRLQRLLRRGRRAPHPDPGERLPGRRHPGPGARVVWGSGGRRADERRRRADERGVPRLHHA
ncbi:aminotransferase class IV [Nocardioides sp. B-3]|nr:aminotransferase class IV [Nocardioides sp. B-3]UUZ58823.1 aminotransferase class IV [Nocardioides sp. B-3]